MKTIILGALLLLVTGCATAPMAPADKDIEAKKFESNKDTGAVYIYRNETFGAAIPMDVAINSKTLGHTAAKTYFKLDLSPGSYNVESRAENTSAITLDVKPGISYFLWQEVKMGIISARSKLQLVSESVGKQGVLESRLINTALSANELLPAGSQQAILKTPSERLAELKALLEAGQISQEEHDASKTKILGGI